MSTPDLPRRVDAHVHLWRLARGDYDWMSPSLEPLFRDFDLSDLEPLLGRAKMHQAILVQAAATVAETEFLLEIAESSRRIAGVVGWVDLAAPDVLSTLRELAARPALRGIRPMIQFIPDPLWMLRPELAAGWNAIANLGLTLDCLVTPTHLEALHSLLARHPSLRAVIDHAAKPAIAGGEFTDWARAMTRIARDTHAYCKLSGLITEAGSGWKVESLRPYVEHLLAEFGPTRLLFGSDWPVVMLAGDYSTWFDAACELLRGASAAEHEAIFGSTATQCYRL